MGCHEVTEGISMGCHEVTEGNRGPSWDVMRLQRSVTNNVFATLGCQPCVNL